MDATGSLSGLIFPVNRLEFAAYGREVDWSINVRGVSGSPTSWSLKARFLDVQEHSYSPQFAYPEQRPFTLLQTGTDVVEGVGWGKPGGTPEPNAGVLATIADNTDDFSGGKTVYVRRTVRVRNLRHKLELSPTFVGGTDPKLVLSLLCTVRN